MHTRASWEEGKAEVQFSRLFMSDSATPWIAACQPSLSITNSQSLLRLMSIELVMPSSHLLGFEIAQLEFLYLL